MAVIVLTFVLCQSAFSQDERSDRIIDRYVQATASNSFTENSGSVQIDINASVPKLKKNGHLRALKVISSVGHSTYRVLSFQGDPTVKKEVIARYLEVDQKANKNGQLAVTPANYKFKFKGEHGSNLGCDVYVFEVSPRKKRTGAFKGELWLDAHSYLPVYERGRLVKNPSIFLKRVEFEQEYALSGGTAVPEHITSTIDARIIGRVEVSVDYSNFAPVAPAEPEAESGQAISEASQ